jgi:hypothetical protein
VYSFVDLIIFIKYKRESINKYILNKNAPIQVLKFGETSDVSDPRD